MKKTIIGNTVLVLAALFSGQSSAATVNFTGKLVVPPLCTVTSEGSSSEMINVTFDSRMDVSKVDGVNFRQPIPYSVNCKAGSSGLDLKLILSGITATFNDGLGENSAILSTSIQKNDFGIRIYQGSSMSATKAFPLNTKNVITLNGDQFKLWASPTKRTGATLVEGTFSATANLTAVYE